jgi:hypothetical protein
MQAANQRAQRAFNRSLILSHVRRERRLSRVGLSRATGLEKSSVSIIVKELIQHGLLVQRERGRSTSAGGRRPIYLRINDRFCSFLGIEVQPRKYRATVVDLSGAVIHREEGEVSIAQNGFARTLEEIYQRLNPIVSALEPPLVAVSVGIPGYVNPHLGTVHNSIPLGLADYDFNACGNPWGVPSWVENDANCCAWAELIEPGTTAAGNFLVLLMEYQDANPLIQQKGGISTGFGIVISGEVYYGADYSSGEFKSLFWRAGHNSQVGIPDERLAAVREDPAVHEAYLEEILLHVSSFMSVLDPERVVFCGDAAPSMERIQRLLHGPLASTWIAEKENARRLCVSGYAEYGVAIGAAGRLLVSLFQPRGFSRERPGSVLDWQRLIAKHGNKVKRGMT